MDIIKFPEKPNNDASNVLELYNILYNTISDYTYEKELTTASLIGVIEILKAEIMNNIISGDA